MNFKMVDHNLLIKPFHKIELFAFMFEVVYHDISNSVDAETSCKVELREKFCFHN